MFSDDRTFLAERLLASCFGFILESRRGFPERDLSTHFQVSRHQAQAFTDFTVGALQSEPPHIFLIGHVYRALKACETMSWRPRIKRRIGQILSRGKNISVQGRIDGMAEGVRLSVNEGDVTPDFSSLFGKIRNLASIAPELLKTLDVHELDRIGSSYAVSRSDGEGKNVHSTCFAECLIILSKNPGAIKKFNPEFLADVLNALDENALKSPLRISSTQDVKGVRKSIQGWLEEIYQDSPPHADVIKERATRKVSFQQAAANALSQHSPVISPRLMGRHGGLASLAL